MNMIVRGGQVIGLVGLVLMAAGVASRLAGRFVIGGFESGSLLIAGIGATAAGCFALLWAIAGRDRP